MSRSYMLPEATKLLVESVKQAMLGMQRASWEQGVAAQALLEWDQACNVDISEDIALYSLCHDAVVRQDSDGRLAVRLNKGDPGLLGNDDRSFCLALHFSLVDELCHEDPASLIEPLLSLAKVIPEPKFEAAARKQIGNLLKEDTPRTDDGTLSHRIDKVQLWVDGIYMGPPALAFAGAYWKDKGLIDEAFKQLFSYHKTLLRPEHQLYGHIWDSASNGWERKTLWGVGNGWALAGTVRVLSTVRNEEYFAECSRQLIEWIKPCLDKILSFQRDDHLFHDTLDDPSTFVDANVAQQVAYTIFRLGQMDKVPQEYVHRAEEMRKAVHARVDKFGILRGVCGSPTFDNSGTATEAQAFFILMEAAYLDITNARHGFVEGDA